VGTEYSRPREGGDPVNAGVHDGIEKAAYTGCPPSRA
jgi:hypothetical protein